MPVGFYFDRLFDWIRLTPSKCNGSERHRYPKSSRSSVWTSGHCFVESVLGLYLCRFINLILGIWKYRTYWVLTAFLLGCQNDQQELVCPSAPANCRGQGISFRFGHLLSDKLWQKQYVYKVCRLDGKWCGIMDLLMETDGFSELLLRLIFISPRNSWSWLYLLKSILNENFLTGSNYELGLVMATKVAPFPL